MNNLTRAISSSLTNSCKIPFSISIRFYKSVMFLIALGFPHSCPVVIVMATITIIIQYVDYNKQVATPKVKVTLKLKC